MNSHPILSHNHLPIPQDPFNGPLVYEQMPERSAGLTDPTRELPTLADRDAERRLASLGIGGLDETRLHVGLASQMPRHASDQTAHDIKHTPRHLATGS